MQIRTVSLVKSHKFESGEWMKIYKVSVNANIQIKISQISFYSKGVRKKFENIISFFSISQKIIFFVAHRQR